MTLRAIALTAAAALTVGLALAAAIAGRRDQPAASPPTAQRQVFAGSWSATGQRQTLPTEHSSAAVIRLSGTVQLSGSNWRDGFQAEAIGFDDGAGATVGRAVWTDSRGAHVYSTLSGESLQKGRLIRGTITGGTDRFAGLKGEYELRWQYVVAGEADVVQGRATDLRGFLEWGATPR